VVGFNPLINLYIYVRLVGHAARIGEGRGMYRVLVGNPERKNHWGDPGVDGRIILRRIFRKWDLGI
jgi:hypothetical protein